MFKHSFVDIKPIESPRDQPQMFKHSFVDIKPIESPRGPATNVQAQFCGH
jgi:hypothetical protein